MLNKIFKLPVRIPFELEKCAEILLNANNIINQNVCTYIMCLIVSRLLNTNLHKELLEAQR